MKYVKRIFVIILEKVVNFEIVFVLMKGGFISSYIFFLFIGFLLFTIS